MSEKKVSGGKVGAALGGVAGVISTIMSNPIGKWMIFNAQDETGLRFHHLIEDLSKNRNFADMAYRIFGVVTNTIMAYPAILPIAGGVIAACVGAVIGRKISKSKLKHKSLTPTMGTKKHSK